MELSNTILMELGCCEFWRINTEFNNKKQYRMPVLTGMLTGMWSEDYIMVEWKIWMFFGRLKLINIILVRIPKDWHKIRLCFTGDASIWTHIADRSTADLIADSVIHCIERVLKSNLALWYIETTLERVQNRKDSRFADLLDKAEVYQ